jgi:type II secretory pathway pseudopilin PulG
MTRRQHKGFTLIEVLLAVTLGFAVIAAAYAALSAAVDSSRRIDGFTEESWTLASLADGMRRQIANAYYSNSSELAPVFTVTPSQRSSVQTQAGQAPADTITFSFAWPSTQADADPQYPFYTVTYFIADASADSPGGLSRRVTPLWPRDVTDEPRDELVAPEVRGLSISCFDGSQWTSEWDAATSGLPRAVRMDLWVDVERFAKDPWRMDTAAAATQAHLEAYHINAWLAATNAPAATGQTGVTAPAGGGSNAAGG